MTHDLPIRSLRPSMVIMVTLIISALLTIGSCASSTGSTALPDDDALVASIDADRIMETIETLQGFGSREFHLESSRQAAEYLYGAFEEIDVPVERQYFMVGDTQVSNVVGTIQGSDEDAGMYLFGAHYDSENRAAYDLSSAENLTAPGADDDASGVAAVLELARVLSGSDFPGTVKLVMFGAEEMGYDGSGGCRGSQYFATQEAAIGRTYSGTAALDMIGYRTGDVNRAVLIVEDDGYVLAKSTEKAVDKFDIDLDIDVLNAPMITYSDHASFWRAGIPSMLVVEELDDERYFPMNPHYHTSYDTADTLSPEQVTVITQALLGGLLLADDDDDFVLIFGTALMSVAIVSVALFVYIRRRRGRVRDDK